MTESRFRERRSAHRDEPGAEPDPPAVEPVEPAPRSAEPAPPAAESVAVTESVPVAESVATEAPPAEEAAPLAEETALLAEEPVPIADLDQLADMEVPEPSFLELIEPHIEMALRFLGELPLTPDGERRVLPRWAKREIDLLGLLEERTRGNLPSPEQEYLQQALDHLRTLYLKASR